MTSRSLEHEVQEILRRYGRSVCSDPQRLKSLLRDRCPEANKGEVHVLVGAVAEGVATELIGSHGQVPDDLLFSRLTRRLQDNMALSEEVARWGVETWAVSLGLAAPGRPVKPPALTQTSTVEQATTQSAARRPNPPPPATPDLARWQKLIKLTMVLASLAFIFGFTAVVILLWPKSAPPDVPLTGHAETSTPATTVVVRAPVEPESGARPAPLPPAEPEAKPGEVVTNSIGMKLVLLPAGQFMMGSPESDEQANADAKPHHRVRITQPFYLGAYEVTQQEWETVMGLTPWRGDEFVREGARYPATYLSYDDALEFCRRLSEREGKSYRLPTEAEWEYACRAGDTTNEDFFEGELWLREYAWIRTNAEDVGEKYAHEVGLKHPNAWGLYDMHGNVWEWCADWFDAHYYAASPGDDPSGALAGADRVSRGGCWGFASVYAQSSFRYNYAPEERNHHLGFRVARNPP